MAPAHLVALAALIGCLPVAPSPTQILDPRLLLVEQRVVAAGEHSPPLSAMPPGIERSAALPGDRVQLRPVAVGPDGPIELDDVILIRRDGLSWPSEEELPTCAEDGLDHLSLCRVAGTELVIPPEVLAPDSLLHPRVLVIASEADGPGAEECLNRLRRDDDEELFGCLLATHRLELGPANAIAFLQGRDDIPPPVDPNYRLSAVWLDLVIQGSEGERYLVAEYGDTVIVRPGDRITATILAPEDELQEYVLGSSEEWTTLTESPNARWWSSARILGEVHPTLHNPSSKDFDAPEDGDGYHLFVLVSERSNAFATGHLIWIQVVAGEVRGEDGGAIP